MDPVHVAYGLLLIALATVGFTAANRLLPWRLLAVSALLAGISEWVEAFLQPRHAGPWFMAVHACLLVTSSLLLVVAAHRTPGAMPGRPWLWLAGIGLFAALVTAFLGPLLGVIIGVVIPGFLIAAWSWWSAGRAHAVASLKVGAAAFVGMAAVLCIGLMVTAEDPSRFHAGGRPWMSVGMVLVLLLATAVATDVGLPAEQRRIRRRQGGIALGALMALIAGLSMLGRWQIERERLSVENELRIHAQAIASELRSRLMAGDIFARMLAGREMVRRALETGDPGLAGNLNADLAGLVDDQRISLAYVMRPDGTVVGTSNHARKDSLMGRNFGFRTYVQQAAAGGMGRQWALGSVTGLLGFYHAVPVRGPEGVVIGVAVIKQNAGLIKDLMEPDVVGWVIDDAGRIFLSSRDEDIQGRPAVFNLEFIWSSFRFDGQDWSVAMGSKDDRLREVVLPVYIALALLGLLICPNFALLIGRETRRHEQARNRAILAQVVDASPDAIALVDADGRVRLANQAMASLRGGSPSDLDGQPLDLVLSGLPPAGTTTELRIACAGGDRVLQATRVELGIGSLVVATDVTALRRAVEDAEAARRRIEELQRATAAYLTTISHEIRSPLGGVVSLAEVLAGGDLSPEQTERVDALRRSVEGILDLLNDVLDHGRLESGRLDLVCEPFDPSAVVMDVVDLMLPRTAGRPVEVVVRIERDLPARVIGDAGRFRQVVANLLSNAFKFTERGEVVIDLLAPADGRLRVVLADTGPGIPADRIGRIFTPFQQADASIANRFGGTGLGLSISNRLVGMMGGSITVDSAPGRGSRFTVDVAATPAAVGSSSGGYRIPLPLPPGTKALVVDNHPLARQVMVEALDAAGCAAVGVADAPQGVQAVVAAEAAGVPFTVAIIDRELTGHGGIWLLTALRSRPGGAALPVVLLTGSPQRGDGEACAMAAIDAYLVKPVRPAILIATMIRAMADHGIPGRRLITRRVIEEDRARPRPIRPLRVLLAEDLPLNRQVFSLLLEDAGCTVLTAEDGIQAQELLRRGGVDLVLMDVNMPRCDGRTATRAWRQAEQSAGMPRVPIIALTGEDGVDDRANCIAAGMDDHLPKPFREEELMELLARWSARG
jgi:signal transduction histidine kinase/CheY-like chemotaxis protein